MKLTSHSAEQISRTQYHRISEEQCTAELLIAQGKTVDDVYRMNEVTQPIHHRWRQQSRDMQAEEARRLTQLERENARLKNLLAEAEHIKAILRDLAEA